MIIAPDSIHNSYKKRGINAERMASVRQYAGHSILDVGCGSGAYVLDLANQYQILGVDYQAFSNWSEKPDLFNVSDATQLNFDDHSIDTILSFELLEHLPEPKKALDEFYRVCRENIIITVPNCEITPGMKRSKLLYYHWIDRTHVNFFTMDGIQELIETAGFEVKKADYINQLRLDDLVEELFQPSSRWGKFLLKSLLKQQRRSYHLTCLIVASKISSSQEA
jgi:ubiquinone/menaquinone biosynthesis C-methylase UbiE